ncbi:hypothetical protein JIN77_16470 [Verrucomicrobiaceae bacterium R5-34]|uniref:Uncharacterized protein n=1 Tax=Oceaniferula flava TaxID=2800421 RepID=A0AAE2VBB9_9BACT|nr:hypothetical protein [Oceaniferula flavus]MBK1832335.1 hypothetical protein [Verrucomicrobiaceae bacterium R5-34]MBK1854370.1 hypothetical protein [Oceaniferula flavus]MBM1135676.1 hypothetical protein [Oceaniferula flavus]
MFKILIITFLGFIPFLQAGVYGSLEFGDSRETVTKKLQSSELVEQKLDSTFFGRTGLNGVFKCKAQLAGLSYHLYFGWDDNGGLNEVTLRSAEVPMSEYGSSIKNAWSEADTLFTRVYNAPAQNAGYPSQSDFKNSDILISHIWHKGSGESILMGPGISKGKCFLAIRFVNRRIQPVRTP